MLKCCSPAARGDMCVAPRICPGPALCPCPSAPFFHMVVSFMEIPVRNFCAVSAVTSVRATNSYALCKDG